MKFSRLITGRSFRGEKGYLETQTKYEIARTVLLFAVSLSLFVAGYITTGKRENLLTIVAILGCLPACKSLISVIMFLRCGHTDRAVSDRILSIESNCLGMFDCVFTTYDKNYKLQHLAVRNSTLIGLCSDSAFDENGFKKHLSDVFKKANLGDVTIKIFTDCDKYINRYRELSSCASGSGNKDEMIIATILDIIL